MPEVTLRRAAQITSTLKRKLDEAAPQPQTEEDAYGRRRRRRGASAPSTSPLAVQVMVDIDTTNAEKIDGARGEWRGRLERLFDLLGIQTRLLQALSSANEKAGVQPLVVERIATLRRQKVLTDALTELNTVGEFNGVEFKVKIGRLRDRLNSATQITEIAQYGETPTPRDKVAVSLLTADDRRQCNENLASVNRRLAEIDDRLVSLNIANKLTITEGDWKVLEREAIV